MAKGQAKQEVSDAILKAFGNKAFLYNDGKEIRVNWTEDGAPVQIKIALTTSKAIVEQGADVALPSTVSSPVAAVPSEPAVSVPLRSIPAPTAEEKQTVAALLKQLGL